LGPWHGNLFSRTFKGEIIVAFCNSNNKQYTFILAPVFCAALAGCGGGDDSSAAASSSTDTLTAVVITESNMADVAGGVIMASTANSLGTSEASLVMGVETNSIPAPTDTLMKLAVEQARAASSRLAAQDAVVGVQSSETVACLDGGSVTYTSSIQSDTGFSAGDTVGISFSNCLEGGMLMNGGLTMTINSFSGDFNPNGAMDISVGFSNLRVADTQSVVNANGDMRIATTFSSSTIDFSILASSIAYGIESGGRSVGVTLTNMNVTAVEDFEKVELRVTEHFAASFPTFSGSGDVSTVTPIVDYFSTVGPDSGTLKVTGGNNSVLYITFLDGGWVLLELDTDNNGSIDASATKSINELDPLAGSV
jgi:hypothetical protein